MYREKQSTSDKIEGIIEAFRSAELTYSVCAAALKAVGLRDSETRELLRTHAPHVKSFEAKRFEASQAWLENYHKR